MKHYRILFALALIPALFSVAGCDDPFNPEENFRMNKDQVISRPQYAEGLLDYAYTQLPYRTFRFDEVATDDAVSNQATNTYRLLATGSWSSLSNAQDMWTVCYRSIMNLNDFLSIIDKVNWNRDSAAEAISSQFMPPRQKMLWRWERMLKAWKISAMDMVMKAMVVPRPLVWKVQAPVSAWTPQR